MTLTVRTATRDDGPALGRMGADLARLHHAIDATRFMLPDGIDEGYTWWMGREVDNPRAVVVVAEGEGGVVGYGYGRLAERDWNRLLDAHGELIDVWVDPAAREAGAGAALVEEVIHRLTAMGAPRVVLSTASGNAAAQRLFARLGFRATMIEMTREG